MRVINAGADKSAASAVLSAVALSEHVVPAGSYDILLSYEESDLAGELWIEGIELEHGSVWEKSVDLRTGT